MKSSFIKDLKRLDDGKESTCFPNYNKQTYPLLTNSFKGCDFFLGAISLGRMIKSSPKIVVNLAKTYEKLHCKGEPYRFSG